MSAIPGAWARLRVRGRGCGCVGAVAGAWARLRVRGRGCGCVDAVAGACAVAWARLRVRGRYLGQLLKIMPRVRFRSVETGEDYADTLEKVKFTSLAWTHDNKVSSLSVPFPYLQAVLRIRIHRIRMFLGILDPDPFVRGTDPNRSIATPF
jgi:hypothetical protein